jgi:excisionase family DNA binding protein
MEEEYITIAEAARKLGDVSDKTIRRAIHSGKLAARYPQPNKAEVSVKDLQEWYASRSVRPGETQDRLTALEAQYTKLLNLWQETRAAMDNIDLLQENLKFEVTAQLSKFATLLKEQDELIGELTARVKLLEEQLQAKKAPRQHKTSIALPDDFSYLSDFCAQHFVPYQAAADLFPHMIRGQYITVQRRKQAVIGPKGRRDFWVQLHSRPDFRACDDCPHEEHGQSV